MNTERTMITFKKAGSKFTYRVGGITIHEGHVLFQRATRDPKAIFWFLPGGRAELGESAEETLKREMQEELGISIGIERLLFIVENFFYETMAHHELGIYFLMQLPPDVYLHQSHASFERSVDDDDLPLIFDWLPIEQLERFDIQPPFFRKALQALPEQPTHIVETHA